MQQVDGQRKGSVLYLHNDFLYRRDKEHNGSKRFRCRRELCTARARQKNGEDVVHLSSVHNHCMEDIGVLQLKTDLKKAAYEVDARTSNKLLFDNLTGNHEAGSRITYAEVEKSRHPMQLMQLKLNRNYLTMPTLTWSSSGNQKLR